MQHSKNIMNPEIESFSLNINAEEFIPKSNQIYQSINYKDFYNDPLNKDINSVIESFLNDPNETTLYYITIIDDKSKFIFDYVCNCAPYSKQILINTKIFIDYTNQIFKLI